MLLPYAVNLEFKCDEAQATVSKGKQLLTAAFTTRHSVEVLGA